MVVRHLAKLIVPPIEAITDFAQQLQPGKTIILVQINVFPAVVAGNELI
jgi:hypothetical protein